MGALRDFVAEVLDGEGALVEPIEPDGLEVLSPGPLRAAMKWPELTRLGFGAELPAGATAVGLDGDWLERFGALLGARGGWSARMLAPGPAPPLGDPERLVERALDLPNAIWRLSGVASVWTRCLLLAFRYTAVSDEQREGVVWLGLNQGTGGGLSEITPRLRVLLADDPEWLAPVDEARRAVGAGVDPASLAQVRPLLDHAVRREIDPFLHAMRRRLDRDSARVHRYHDDLRAAALKKLGATNGKGDNDRRRETLRVAAIEREYAAKLDDLKRNYALAVSTRFVQGLELFAPAQRFDILIRRRKGERRIALDWHSALRAMDAPPSDAGPALGRTRFVCDDALHLTDAAAQGPCPGCAKAFCRACHPSRCPRCGRSPEGVERLTASG
jgi:hypothetical protein